MTDELILRREIAAIAASNRQLMALVETLYQRFPLIKKLMSERYAEGAELSPEVFASLVEEAICAKLREFVRAYERVYVRTQRHPTIADEAEVMRLLRELPK